MAGLYCSRNTTVEGRRIRGGGVEGNDGFEAADVLGAEVGEVEELREWSLLVCKVMGKAEAGGCTSTTLRTFLGLSWRMDARHRRSLFGIRYTTNTNERAGANSLA